MNEDGSQGTLKDKLIQAGLEELNEHGAQEFSVRRVANRCGVSCAAPYKHFADKQSFIAAIIDFINARWNERQVRIMKEARSEQEQLVKVSVEYIRFLVENPHFRSVIMLKNEEFDRRYGNYRGRLSMLTYVLVERYCRKVNMPEEVKRRKLYVVRSLIYGAALMFDNGEMEYTDENMKLVEFSIDREFSIE